MFVDILRWWLSAQILGLLALPLVLWFFRRLPDRGYSFARSFGLLLAGYGAWLLSMLGLGALGRGLLLLVGLLLLGGGVALLRREGLRRAGADLRARLPWIVCVELLFALGIFAGVALRWYDFWGFGVSVQHTEQSMDLALLSGILASRQFPPQDPWLAPYPINYYYLGYLLVAALTRLSGVAVGAGYTLGIATIWALAATGTAGLIYNMIGLGRTENTEQRTKNQEPRTENQEPRTKNQGLETSSGEQRRSLGTENLKHETWNLKLLYPLLGVFFVLLAANQSATLQILAGSEKVVALGARDTLVAVINGLGPRATLDLPGVVVTDDLGDPTMIVPEEKALAPSTDWWPSRAVWDDFPNDDGTVSRRYNITEFPLFSFLLGDLHPHVLSLPWVLLALALALNVLARRSAPELRARGGWVELAITGIVLGGLYAINSWDLPTYLLIYLGALLLLYLRLAPSPRALFWPHLLQQAGLVVVASYGLYLPFHMSFEAPTADPPIGIAPARTSLWEFMVVFGLFAVPLLVFVWREAWGEHRTKNQEPRTKNQEPRTKNQEPRTKNQGLETSSGEQRRSLGTENLKHETWNLKQSRYVRNVSLGLLATLIAGTLVGWSLFVLLPLALLAAWAAYRNVEQPGVAFALWIFAVGALVVWGCDVVYLRDNYGSPRMNTIFKFYYQVWLIWGVAAAFALWRLLGRLRPVSLLWLIPTGLLLVSACSYLLVAPSRNAPPREIDGLAYLRRDAPDEAAAVDWVRQNTSTDAVIAMAPGRAYDPSSSRIASATGRPTIVGWTQHERLWRGGQPELAAQVDQREQDLRTLYTTSDQSAAQEILNKYGARYVYVGANERKLAADAGAPPEALSKFDQFMSPVFQQGGVVLYH